MESNHKYFSGIISARVITCETFIEDLSLLSIDKKRTKKHIIQVLSDDSVYCDYFYAIIVFILCVKMKQRNSTNLELAVQKFTHN